MKISENKEKMILPNVGTPVKTVIDVTMAVDGFFVHKHNIDARVNSTGVIKGFVPGAGGDVWWVDHEDGTIGAYMFTEVFDRE